MSLRWVPPANGSLRIDLLAGRDAAAERVDRGAHRRRHRAEVHGDVLGLHEQLAVGGEQRGRAVGPLLDVRAERGAAQHRAHLLGDAGRAARSGPAAPPGRALTAPIPPRSTQRAGGAGLGRASRRAPRSCSRARRRPPGPIAPARSDGGQVGRRRPATAARRRGPQGDDLDRRVRAGRSRCGARARPWKSSTDGDGELVALPGVAAVERRSSTVASRRRPSRGRLGGRARSSASSSPSWSSGVGPRPHELALRAARTAARPPRARRPAAGRSPPACRAPRPARRRAAARRRRTRPAPAPRVDAPLDRHRPHRLLHRRVDHRDDALGGRRPAPSSARRGRVDVERAEPGKRGVGRDAAGDEVGVGHRRLGAAAPVAGRARARRPALAGPTTERAAGVDAARSTRRRRRSCGRRATAAAPGSPPTDALGRRLRHAAEHEAHVGAACRPCRSVTASGKPLAAATRGRGPHAARPGPTAAARPAARRPSATGTSPPADVITSTSSASVAEPRRGTRGTRGRR